MSLDWTEGARFTRPSEVIQRLKYARSVRALTDIDFQIMGAGDYERAIESGSFVQASPVSIYVMTGNSSATLLTDVSDTENEVTHSIDILLYCQTRDNRSQYNDQLSVWFKEFLIWALQGYMPDPKCEPLLPAGDSLQQIRNVADYSRIYQFYQVVTVTGEDVLGNVDESTVPPDELPDFLEIYNQKETIAPDFDELTPELESTVFLRS